MIDTAERDARVESADLELILHEGLRDARVLVEHRAERLRPRVLVAIQEADRERMATKAREVRLQVHAAATGARIVHRLV